MRHVVSRLGGQDRRNLGEPTIVPMGRESLLIVSVGPAGIADRACIRAGGREGLGGVCNCINVLALPTLRRVRTG